MAVAEFSLDNAFLIRTSGTSDGTQDKFFKDGLWFKLDRYGGEGIAETAASIILRESGMDESQFVSYLPCLINGKTGCYSANFLQGDEEFITLYRLYKNSTGRDLAAVCEKMDYDDAIEYVLRFVQEQTGLTVREYLANTFALDKVILNEDRHFNNLGVIYDGTAFKTAPIFDNGKSFLIGNKTAAEKKSLPEKIAVAYAKVFSPSFEVNARYLQQYCTLHISPHCIEKIKSLGNSDIVALLQHTFPTA